MYNAMDNKTKLEYALKLKRLHEIMVVKENLYFAHQNANYNRAAYHIDKIVDKHLEEHIINTVDGTISLTNHNDKLDKIMSTTLNNQRKRVLKKTNRYIDKAVENNINTYSNFLKNRINKESVSLASKIEQEARKKQYKHLTDTETKKLLQEKFSNHGRRRAKNILRDALHTNQSNISWIHGIQQGYKYKIWNNGAGKGRVRPWHRAKKIQPVPIDEFFDIYGSYPAYMMYPGDLNGGAENVANCRCWLNYTNQKPQELKTRGIFTISNNVELQPTDKHKPKTEVPNPKQETTSPEPKPRITEKIKTKIQNTVKNIKNRFENPKKNFSDKINQRENLKDSFNLKKKPVRLYPQRTKPKKKLSTKIKESLDNLTFSIKNWNKIVVEHKDVKIIKDKKANYISVDFIKEVYNQLSPVLTENVEEIRIINKECRDGNEYTPGAVSLDNPNVIELYYVPIDKTIYSLESIYYDVITHESAHVYDMNHNKQSNSSKLHLGVSNSREWERAVKLDNSGGDPFVSNYASKRYFEYKKAGLTDRLFAEDFAESIMKIYKNENTFRERYPNRYNLIKYLLNGGML